MLMFLALFGLLMIGGGFYVSLDKSRARKEKLAKIQRELSRREAAEKSREAQSSETLNE